MSGIVAIVRKASLGQGGSLDPTKEEKPMPEVYVYAVEGRSAEQKKSLMKDITEAVIKHFGAPADAVIVQIVEASKTDKAKGGVPFSER
jgi:4-oxalocrotonate tautomerase